MVATISLEGNSNEPVYKLRKCVQFNIKHAIEACDMPELVGLLLDPPNTAITLKHMKLTPVPKSKKPQPAEPLPDRLADCTVPELVMAIGSILPPGDCAKLLHRCRTYRLDTQQAVLQAQIHAHLEEIASAARVLDDPQSTPTARADAHRHWLAAHDALTHRFAESLDLQSRTP